MPQSVEHAHPVMAGYNRDDTPPDPVLPGRKSFAVTAMQTGFHLQTCDDTALRSEARACSCGPRCVHCSREHSLAKGVNTHPDRCPLLKARRRTSAALPLRRADRPEVLLHHNARCSAAMCMSCRDMPCMMALPAGCVLSRCTATGQQIGLR